MSLHGREILDPDYYERYGYPHPAFAWLRRHEPVSWHEPPGMLPFWAITRYADVEAISRDRARFKIAPRMAVFPEEQYSTEEFPYHHLLTMDPPEHLKYRRLMSQSFTPKVLEPKREAIRQIVADVLDRMAGKTKLDFVEEIAIPIPLQAIADMLGVPREDWDRMVRLSNVLVGATDEDYQAGTNATSAEEASKRAVEEIFAYFRALAEDRRKHPRDDFITVLASAEVEGKSIGDWELMSYYALLIVAGNETTRNAASGGLIALLQHPAELEKLRRNPELVASAAEEIVRWTSPVIQFCRTTTENVEIRGVPVAKGQACCLLYPSANRDEDVFPDPFAFRVDREPNEHFGFGIGIHHCLGANLARIELQELFSQLVRRVDEIELAGPVERMRGSFVGGIKRVPIRYRLREDVAA